MSAARPTRECPGLLAEFDRLEDLARAARRARALGFRRLDAFSPFPSDELSDALELPPSRLPLVMLAAGAAGAALAYALQYYTSVIAYPHNVGGRPLHSWPAFVPVTFEVTILFAALSGFIGFFFLTRLPRLHHPVFQARRFRRASEDGFFLFLGSEDPAFESEAARRLLAEHDARAVTEVSA